MVVEYDDHTVNKVTKKHLCIAVLNNCIVFGCKIIVELDAWIKETLTEKKNKSKIRSFRLISIESMGKIWEVNLSIFFKKIMQLFKRSSGRSIRINKQMNIFFNYNARFIEKRFSFNDLLYNENRK